MKRLLEPNQYAFLYFLQFGLNGTSKWEKPENFSFEYVCKESNEHQLTGIIFDGILKSGFAEQVPDEMRNKWKTQAMRGYLAVEQIMNEQNFVLKALGDAGVACAVMKGSSVAVHYPNPCLRVQGDIDLIVPEEQMQKCLEILHGMGYEDEEGEADHHDNVKKGNFLIEVHSTLGGIPDSKTEKKVDELFSHFDANLTELLCAGYKVPALDTTLQSVSLLVHIIHHLTSGGIGFRQICDWGFFALKTLNSENIDECADILKNLGIYKFACIMSDFCRTWLGFEIDVFGEAGNSAEETKPILDDIFAAGDFGKKDINRYRSRFFVNDVSGKKGFFGKIATSWRTMHDIALQRYPIFEKIIILKPFAFITIPIGYCFRILTGKTKKETLKASVDLAKRQNEIYKKMDLFKK